MRTLRLLILPLALMLISCHEIEKWDNDPKGNFDALWTLVDERYCFFGQNGVDWDACHDKYGAMVFDGISSKALFSVCANMLNELRDGHVNLSSGFTTSYYTAWWSDYPQNYDKRLVEQYYLGFDCYRLGAVEYAILPQGIGYVNYPSFESGLGPGNIDNILACFSLCTGIIIDLRDNGGGNMDYAKDLARRFMQERTLAGYMINKTGPGHDELSEPFEYYFDPIESPHLSWSKPVVVLTNRSTFSAANNFVSVVKYLPNVKIVGTRTGGGSGMPLSMELPNGWCLRMSSVSVLDASKQSTEGGIDPSEGCEVALDPELALQGIDTMIEKAIDVLNNW